MYEHRLAPLLSRRQFSLRMLKHTLAAIAFITVSVAIGAAGFICFEGNHWHDALLHASMLLAGLGLLAYPSTLAAKIFISVFALYAALAYAIIASIIFAPLIHRILHVLHHSNKE